MTISVEEVLQELIHKGGGKGLFRRLYLTKAGKEHGESRGRKYWTRRNKVGKVVATAAATELVPGGTAINAIRLGRYLSKKFKRKKTQQRPKLAPQAA